jgi:hypothetical protein
VNYLVQLVGVALFRNTSTTIYDTSLKEQHQASNRETSVYVGRVLHQIQPANLEAMIGSRFVGFMFEALNKCLCCHMGNP